MSGFLGGMLDPAIDRDGEPFSYFRHPTDVLGVPFLPVASEVTPEGYIFTGFGELIFFRGNPPEPIEHRVRVLADGHLPIIRHSSVLHDVRYAFECFATEGTAELSGLPLNVVRAKLTNEGTEQRAAFLSSAYRFSAPVDHLKGPVPAYRFGQRRDLFPDDLIAGLEGFDPTWRYEFTRDCLCRDGRVLYWFPTDPPPYQAALSLGDSGLRAIRYLTGEVRDNPNARVMHHPTTPMGVVMYRVVLQPGESLTLDFRMPIIPVPLGSAAAVDVAARDVDADLADVVREWQSLLAPCPFRFPEEKVQDYLLANTAFDILAVDRVDDAYVVNVNKFQYHRLYPGNGSNMCIAFDYMGLHELAGACLRHFRAVQFSDGSIRNPHNPSCESHEITCYALWAWGRHYELTRDDEFLRAVYPGVPAAIDWLIALAADDPLGLLPAATVADDAMLANVHQTGMSLWALIALRSAKRMADWLGEAGDARRFADEYHRYREAFEAALVKVAAQTGGSIPPALDRPGAGNRWDDLLLLYPDVLFDPADPRVAATIREARKTYGEGILGFVWPHAVGRTDPELWPPASRDGLPTTRAEGFVFDETVTLHYWQTPNNAQNALVRGLPEDQQAAVEDLYALLLHTSSTHAPQEFGTVPWSTRDHLSVHNILPDGAASAKTIELLRNMLVREEGNELVLLSAVSPAWLEAGKTLRIEQAATAFGAVSLSVEVSGDSRDVEIRFGFGHAFREVPDCVRLRIPWFIDVIDAEVDGRQLEAHGGELRLGSDWQCLKVRGRRRAGVPDLSYPGAVQAYRDEYRRRYERFLRTGVGN